MAGRTKNLPGRRALSGHVLPFSCPGHCPCNGSSGPTCRFGGSRCSGGANRPCAVVRSLADGLQTASRLCGGNYGRTNLPLASRRCKQPGPLLLPFRQILVSDLVRLTTALLCMDRFPAPRGHCLGTQAKTVEVGTQGHERGPTGCARLSL